jgi:hypothetical protein
MTSSMMVTPARDRTRMNEKIAVCGEVLGVEGAKNLG